MTTNLYSLKDFKQILRLENETKQILSDEKIEAAPFNAFAQNGKSFFSIINYQNLSYLFVSPSVKYITGYSSEEWMKGGMDFTFKNFHPDEMNTHKAVHKKILENHYSVPFEERLKYNYSYDFHFKRADNKYIRLLIQIICSEIDYQGSPLKSYNVTNDISSFKKDKRITLSINKCDQSKDFGDIIIDFYPEEINCILTKRELEIIQLVHKGFTSKEIADKLFISKNTVDTHRRKILKKIHF